jgi:hypothetical protein
LRRAAMLGQRFHIEQFADRHAESCQKNGMKKETLGSYSQYNGQSQTRIILDGWVDGLRIASNPGESAHTAAMRESHSHSAYSRELSTPG